MTKASLITHHDYISVRIKFDAGKLNLTVNRWGTKCTADMALGDHFELAAGAFDRLYTVSKGKDLIPFMEKVQEMAEKSTDIVDFTNKLRAAAE